ENLNFSRLQQRAEQALKAVDEEIRNASDDWRDRERKFNHYGEQPLAAEIEFGDRPGGRNAEDGVDRDGDQRSHNRQGDGVARVGMGTWLAGGLEAERKSLGEDNDQRRHDEQRAEQEHKADQQAAGGSTFADARWFAGPVHQDLAV